MDAIGGLESVQLLALVVATLAFSGSGAMHLSRPGDFHSVVVAHGIIPSQYGKAVAYGFILVEGLLAALPTVSVFLAPHMVELVLRTEAVVFMILTLYVLLVRARTSTAQACGCGWLGGGALTGWTAIRAFMLACVVGVSLLIKTPVPGGALGIVFTIFAGIGLFAAIWVMPNTLWYPKPNAGISPFAVTEPTVQSLSETG